mgnify:CR=1 FL=1
MDNKFGTAIPVPFQDWSHPIPNQMTGTMSPLRVEVKCFGKYTFKIEDPAVFMSKVAGTADEFRKDAIVDQMRSEVIGSFQNVLNELGNSEHKTPVLELPSSTDEIKKVMDEKVFDQPIRDRGLSIVGFIVESVTLDEESEKKIDNYELSSNSFMQQGTLVGAYANAVQDAANNANGAMNGFMGVNMMNNMSNNSTVETLYKLNQEKNTNNNTDTWTCACGAVNQGKFCQSCGSPKPAGAPVYKCDKCGWQPAAPSQMPKFCPQCGDIFDANDAQ